VDKPGFWEGRHDFDITRFQGFINQLGIGYRDRHDNTLQEAKRNMQAISVVNVSIAYFRLPTN
jgi:hypothetical protein